MTQFVDFIIIGSGASGSVMANYLARAGASVVVLEAGQRHSAKTFPRNELLANAQLFWGGGMDATANANLLFLRGKVLGGGTIVNQCLLDRFDDVVFDQWRDVSGVDFFRESVMGRHYDEIESNLVLQKIERDQWNKNAQMYVEAFEKLGYGWAPLRRGQSNCSVDKNDCMACLGGCRRDSKQSMLVSFIPKAEAAGAKFVTGFEVSGIVHGPRHVAVHGRQKGESQVLYARKVVVAAGTLGTNHLMLKSGFKPKLPALGENFFGHPQWMNLALFDDKIDAHKGALQGVKSDDARFREMGFKLENVFVGPIGATMLIPAHGAKMQDYMKRYRYMASTEVCIRDVEPGTIRMGGNGRLNITKPIGAEDSRRGMAGVKVVRELYQALGAKEFITSNFNFSLHQMGGCAIGNSPSTAVVNERFEVFGLENLTIADGSVFPRAPGINPSLSIMANSHRAAQGLLEEFGSVVDVKHAKKKEVSHV